MTEEKVQDEKSFSQSIANTNPQTGTNNTRTKTEKLKVKDKK